jgi:hypothetical protein
VSSAHIFAVCSYIQKPENTVSSINRRVLVDDDLNAGMQQRHRPPGTGLKSKTYVLEDEAVDVDELLMKVRRHVGRASDLKNRRRLPVLDDALPLPGRHRHRHHLLRLLRRTSSERDAALRRVSHEHLPTSSVLRYGRRRQAHAHARGLLLELERRLLMMMARPRRRRASSFVARRPRPSRRRRVGELLLPLLC